MITDEQKANRKRWIEALRSGNYKQGKNRLCTLTADDPYYCCLGVAYEIFKDQFGIETIDYHSVRRYDGEAAYIKHRVLQNALGIAQNGQFQEPIHGRYSLVSLNDDGFTFEEIADIIEKNEDNFVETIHNAAI